MAATFAVSSVLLVAVMLLHYVECRRMKRFGAHVRDDLDLHTTAAGERLKRWSLAAIEYIHKDVLLKALHVLTYIALLLVRKVESRLDRGTKFIRRFRHRRKGTPS
jgi:hypothetical protein